MAKMREIFLAIAVLAACFAVLHSASVEIRDTVNGPRNKGSREWNGSSNIEIGGELYYLDNFIIGSWQLAWTICNEINMTLLSLDSKEKNDLISSWLEENYPDPVYALWTSGYQAANEEWIWRSTGEPIDMSQADWLPDRPDEDTEKTNCLSFHFGERGWEDDQCSITYMNYMCEMPRDRR